MKTKEQTKVGRAFTEEQAYEMAQAIYEYAMNALRSLGRDANVIAYILQPESTATGALFDYNAETFEHLLWPKILNYARNCPKDGNADFDLKGVYRAVKRGRMF